MYHFWYIVKRCSILDGMDRGMPHDGREHPTEHLGTARSRRAAIDAATRIYLDGGALDMSALAEDLGVGRTTLYRWVGNRENLLSTVLAEATVRTFRKAAADADRGGGVEHVLDVMHRFMRAVAAAPPLQALSKREHLLFIRLTMMPGPVETAAARMITEMLETEAAGPSPRQLPARTPRNRPELPAHNGGMRTEASESRTGSMGLWDSNPRPADYEKYGLEPDRGHPHPVRTPAYVTRHPRPGPARRRRGHRRPGR
jgi:AcrR family transcriptional regulator